MAGRFDFSSVANQLDSLTKGQVDMPAPLIQDKRTRSEVREDYDKKLKALDKKAIEALKNKVSEAYSSEDIMLLKDDIEDSLAKFIRYYDAFENLNLDESRKVVLKEKELKLEASYDWRAKARLFFFRILGSALVVITLFGIGYIESEYEWAKLPMSKYLVTNSKLPQ
jgi:hypothetical protein